MPVSITRSWWTSRTVTSLRTQTSPLRAPGQRGQNIEERTGAVAGDDAEVAGSDEDAAIAYHHGQHCFDQPSRAVPRPSRSSRPTASSSGPRRPSTRTCTGLRGGGGNVGVVTRAEDAPLPYGEIHAGTLLWPYDRHAEVLRDWTRAAPETVTISFRIMHFPPLPELPPFLAGRSALLVDRAVAGDAGQARPSSPRSVTCGPSWTPGRRPPRRTSPTPTWRTKADTASARQD